MYLAEYRSDGEIIGWFDTIEEYSDAGQPITETMIDPDTSESVEKVIGIAPSIFDNFENHLEITAEQKADGVANPGKYKVEAGALVVDPAWTDPNSPAEVEARAWAALRRERERRLAETDFAMLADNPATLSAAQTDTVKAYRIALRELPANTTDPAAPVWPTLTATLQGKLHITLPA